MHMMMTVTIFQAINVMVIFSILIHIIPILMISLMIMSAVVMPMIMIVFFERTPAVTMILIF